VPSGPAGGRGLQLRTRLRSVHVERVDDHIAECVAEQISVDVHRRVGCAAARVGNVRSGYLLVEHIDAETGEFI
jgi:hypothetical protein